MTPRIEPSAMRVVTVSASYGAGGSIVAPALAERLELPFYDRLLRGPEAGSAVHIIEQLSEEERELAPSGRAVTSLGYVTGGLGMPVPTADDLNPTDEMRRQIDASVHRIAHTTGGVILGRGGVVVLAGSPLAFHVRLDGPVQRRIAQGMAIEGVSEQVARQHQGRADRAWTKFGQRVFGRDFTDARLYHLVLDSTAVPLADCVAVLATAATAYWSAT